MKVDIDAFDKALNEYGRLTGVFDAPSMLAAIKVYLEETNKKKPFDMHAPMTNFNRYR